MWYFGIVISLHYSNERDKLAVPYWALNSRIKRCVRRAGWHGCLWRNRQRKMRVEAIKCQARFPALPGWCPAESWRDARAVGGLDGRDAAADLDAPSPLCTDRQAAARVAFLRINGVTVCHFYTSSFGGRIPVMQGRRACRRLGSRLETPFFRCSFLSSFPILPRGFKVHLCSLVLWSV